MAPDIRHKPDAWRNVADGTGSGSQPRVLPPKWWPIWGNKPVTHVYRIMRVDMDDLQMVREDVEKMQGYERGGEMFKSETLRAVLYGSKGFRSPFLHCSICPTVAQKWGAMSACNARLTDPTREVLTVRIDIWAWHQSGTMPNGAIIDLSNSNAQHMFVERPNDGLPTVSSDEMWEAIRLSRLFKEVLLCWRGKVPLQYFEVINDNTGIVLGKLDDLLAMERQHEVGAPSQGMLEDASGRAQKQRKPGNMRIPLDKIGFMPDNRGGVGCSSHHVHEAARGLKANKTELARYDHVDPVEIPSDALQEIRGINALALMPRFSSGMQYVCASKTHFVHCQKLAKDGNRFLFNEGETLPEEDVEGNQIQEQGPVRAINHSASFHDSAAMGALAVEDNLQR